MLERGHGDFYDRRDRCTRACGFCAVTTAKPFAIEDDEPERVAQAVGRMKLKHVVTPRSRGTISRTAVRGISRGRSKPSRRRS